MGGREYLVSGRINSSNVTGLAATIYRCGQTAYMNGDSGSIAEGRGKPLLPHITAATTHTHAKTSSTLEEDEL